MTHDSVRALASLAMVVVIAAAINPTALAVDLGDRYPATREHPTVGQVYDAPAGKAEIWRVSSFRFDLAEQLAIDCGPASVALGRADSIVLWAALLPDSPGTLRVSDVDDPESFTSLWIRFHPSRVGDLFQASTLVADEPLGGSVAEQARFRAMRLAQHKMRSSFQFNGRPSVPSPHMFVFDAEAVNGLRRFVVVNIADTSVRYYPQFEQQGLSPERSITPDDAQRSFDRVWSAFDGEYAMFTIRPELDWRALRERYRPVALEARTNVQLAHVLARMLAHLGDLHVSVRIEDEYLSVYERERPLNASPDALNVWFSGVERHPAKIGWARSEDGMGYLNIWALDDDRLPGAFDRVLEKLGDTWALVVDLRYNGGGDETLGQRIAGRFLDREVTYSYSQYRNGPKHDDLTPPIARTCEPRGPWRYEAPVIVLQGRRTMSSAESFVLMLAQAPNVTTMGDHTAGSSGNPRQLQLPGEIVVTLPRWMDLKPDRTPLDHVGVEPDVWIDAPVDAFTNKRDPVLEAALQRLQEIPASERVPGKRSSTHERVR